ncbi:hypothetical protein ABB37_04602 [Leptomonas pyrrhocoris]|uniref:RecA-like N-terminal domain-containing protein n=1 Tax=Leptomonas pyrrhocoris TaxID=157538 RepID=A0A0M9G1L9_LEPPY|nr:hypothetical protein ABB37_04602 [Leptomonas pyrrhocoris]KPA80329.1 hypothetical protein ABB37_04602 [Leptomonas pyrrhocoris]|eukprot:XP_015658768.1 hypothetical protein ABB37_04602 [Leptomonas pyrrhocoris]
MEREAFALLTRCAACLSLRGQQSPSQAMGPSRQGDTTHSGGSLSTLHGCSTFSLLRTSAGPLSLIGPAAPYWCSTGCVGLDRALGGGGFRSGWVTEVYGEAGAGKTQLGLQCLLQQSAHDLCKSAAALCLAHNPQFAALRLLQQQQQQNTQSTQGMVQRCNEAFHVESVKAARCAVVYLVSEEVPTSRLGPLAAAAVRRAVRAVQLHPLITSLPSGIVEAVMRSVRQTCTDTMVLSCLQIRHIASMQELLRLVEPHAAAAPPPSSPGEGRSSCSLSDAVRMLSGSLGRALIVLDSIAAAVVAGQADIHGIAQTDASVAAIATQLRCAAARHNWCVVGINQVRATRHHSTGSSCTQFKRTRSPTSSSSLSSSGFSADGSHTVVPALGLAWSSASQCRVHLRKSLSLGVRQLILRQSPAHPPSQASYVITQNGIEDA